MLGEKRGLTPRVQAWECRGGMSGSDQIFLQYFPFYSAVTERSALTPSKVRRYMNDENLTLHYNKRLILF